MRPIIYQLLPRLYTNYSGPRTVNGDIEANGCGKLNHFTPKILREIKSLGITDIWFTGVIEHAQATDYSAYGITPDNCHVVKGKAGSPYAIKDYYDIDPDLAENVPARMKEFEALVERVHKEGMRFIIDFVPNHTARVYHSDVKPKGVEDFGSSDRTDWFFRPDNNYYYLPRQQFAPSGVDLGTGDKKYVEFPAKATGNDCFSAFPGVNDWYETAKLNYGLDYGNGESRYQPIPDTWHKMLHILKFWASKGVDAFRCDMAFMVPIEFWLWVIPQVKAEYPAIRFIAEIYDVNLYRPFLEAGFDYLYDKVNLYDTLRGIETGDLSAAELTSCWQRIDGITSRMLNFLENHDEQRFASKYYAGDPWRAIPSMVASALMSTGAVMIYGGQELGETASGAPGFSGDDGRTTIFDYWNIPSVAKWLNNGECNGKLHPAEKALREFYARLLKLCNDEKSFREGPFFDLMYVNYDSPGFDPHHHYAFLRGKGNDVVLVAVNFSNYPAAAGIKIPEHAFDCLQLPEGEHQAINLLDGRMRKVNFRPDELTNVEIPPKGAIALKIIADSNNASAPAPAIKKNKRPSCKKSAPKD